MPSVNTVAFERSFLSGLDAAIKELRVDKHHVEADTAQKKHDRSVVATIFHRTIGSFGPIDASNFSALRDRFVAALDIAVATHAASTKGAKSPPHSPRLEGASGHHAAKSPQTSPKLASAGAGAPLADAVEGTDTAVEAISKRAAIAAKEVLDNMKPRK